MNYHQSIGEPQCNTPHFSLLHHNQMFVPVSPLWFMQTHCVTDAPQRAHSLQSFHRNLKAQLSDPVYPIQPPTQTLCHMDLMHFRGDWLLN